MRNVLLTLAGALFAVSVSAHTQLSSAAPGDGDTLSAAPDELVLAFTEPVMLTAVVVHAADGAAHEVELPDGRSERFALTAPELGPGSHRVEWRALSEDTHVIDGELSFTVEARAAN